MNFPACPNHKTITKSVEGKTQEPQSEKPISNKPPSVNGNFREAKPTRQAGRNFNHNTSIMNNNTKARYKRLGGARSAKDKRPCVGQVSACQPTHNPNKHKHWNFRGPFGH